MSYLDFLRGKERLEAAAIARTAPVGYLVISIYIKEASSSTSDGFKCSQSDEEYKQNI
ncbi:hypothetical protein RchiOBHm_Chr7g0201131 [Rosa chinensis]|uniref:Uncharacterized protein n=1 Tax=Rosa chinensis TaxID=74649 RepID=A0A2P6P7U7_ROSCH|nr:hypothetical protein RchiOBHm_Chr7g0201131 [Rosa chinensis]